MRLTLRVAVLQARRLVNPKSPIFTCTQQHSTARHSICVAILQQSPPLKLPSLSMASRASDAGFTGAHSQCRAALRALFTQSLAIPAHTSITSTARTTLHYGCPQWLQTQSHLAIRPHKQVGAAQVSMHVILAVQVAHAGSHIMQHLQPPVPVEVRHVLQTKNRGQANRQRRTLRPVCWLS